MKRQRQGKVSVPVRAFVGERGECVVEGKVVEYERPTLVSDRSSGLPYTEKVASGAFELPRVGVPLMFENDDQPIGRVVLFEERPDGLFARCQLGRSDEARLSALVSNGVLSGLTPVFAPLRTRLEGRVVVRERARLLAVSLCRWPVYPGSRRLLRAGLHPPSDGSHSSFR